MAKYTDPEVIKKSEDIFEKYFKFGFFGRQALVIGYVKKLSGYSGTDQTFHRYVWLPWFKKKTEANPEIMEGLKKLQEELSNVR